MISCIVCYVANSNLLTFGIWLGVTVLLYSFLTLRHRVLHLTYTCSLYRPTPAVNCAAVSLSLTHNERFNTFLTVFISSPTFLHLWIFGCLNLWKPDRPNSLNIPTSNHDGHLHCNTTRDSKIQDSFGKFCTLAVHPGGADRQRISTSILNDDDALDFAYTSYHDTSRDWWREITLRPSVSSFSADYLSLRSNAVNELFGRR